MADLPSTAEIAGRIVLAAVLGGFVGFEREVDDHPAGLRTHIAVCVGAALFGAVSAYGFTEFDRPREGTTYQVDVTRVASQVVSGMGFLGGGAILKYGATVKGLTTAASLWVTAAIGLAVAFGEYPIALVSTAVILASLAVLRFPARYIDSHFHKPQQLLVVRLAPGAAAPPVIAEVTGLPDLDVHTLHIEHDDKDATVISAHAKGRRDARLQAAVAALAERDDVDSVELS